MTRDVRFQPGTDTNAFPSAGIWGNFPPDFWYNPFVAYGFFDDFTTHNSAVTTTGTSWTEVGDGSVVNLASEIGGVIRLDTTNTDNDEEYISWGDVGNAFVKMGAGVNPLAWECRFRLGSIVDQGVFIGLTEEGCAAANLLTDNTGVVAAKDTVGFRILVADPDGLDAVYNTASTESVHEEAVQVVVASTWYKIGGYYDGTTYWYFLNGQKTDATGVLYSATNFPDGEELTFTAGLKTGEAVTKTLDFDWVGVYQLR